MSEMQAPSATERVLVRRAGDDLFNALGVQVSILLRGTERNSEPLRPPQDMARQTALNAEHDTFSSPVKQN